MAGKKSCQVCWEPDPKTGLLCLYKDLSKSVLSENKGFLCLDVAPRLEPIYVYANNLVCELCTKIIKNILIG